MFKWNLKYAFNINSLIEGEVSISEVSAIELEHLL